MSEPHRTSKLGALRRLPNVLGELTGNQGKVLTMMVCYIGKGDLTFVGTHTIAQKLKLADDRSVERVIVDLRKFGYLTLAQIGGGSGNVNQYKVTLPDEPVTETPVESAGDLAQETAAESAADSALEPRSNKPGITQTPAEKTPVVLDKKPRLFQSQNPGQNDPPISIDYSFDYSNTPPARGREVSKGRKLDDALAGMPPLPDSLNTPTFKRTWEEWIQHRKEIGEPLKPMQARKQLNRLAKEGEELAVVRLERSIENGWTGLWFKDDNLKGSVKHGSNGQRTKPTAQQRGEFAEPDNSIPDFVGERH